LDASLRRVLFGTDEEVAESTTLRAGLLTLTLRGAKIWDIRCGEREAWHGLAFLYRDADWGTPEPVVDDVESTVGALAFRLRLEGHFAVTPAIDFTLTITGDSTGCITFSGEAIPRGDIQASRLGVCVMHPMSACGSRIEVEHADGRVSRSTFPTLIPPWPPFMLIRAIRHEYAPDCWARCAFDGDVFELEDQRNNSDASFKTYSRSNLMPRPYWLRANVPIRQSVTMRMETTCASAPTAQESTVVRVRIGAETAGLPRIGIEIAARDAQAGAAVHAALRTLNPAHLHLALCDSETEVDWHGIGQLLTSAGAELRLDLTVDYQRAEEKLAALRSALSDAGIVPAGIAVFPSEERPLAAARRAFPDSRIGGGTPHFFVQLNRIERLGRVDFLSFTTSPIVHGADDASVMLTLQSLPSMVETLRSANPGARFAVGPSTIAARKSPLGRQPDTDGLHRIALARNDPRCRGLFGAAWLLGYVAQLASAGVEALSLMALSGASGILAEDKGSGSERRPTYSILERLRGPARVCAVSVSDPARVAALALRRDDGSELLIANLTSGLVEVEIDGWKAGSSCAVLDADACKSIASNAGVWSARRTCVNGRVQLSAYAVASLT
jgi:hypothetical protein